MIAPDIAVKNVPSTSLLCPQIKYEIENSLLGNKCFYNSRKISKGHSGDAYFFQ